MYGYSPYWKLFLWICNNRKLILLHKIKSTYEDCERKKSFSDSSYEI